MKHLSWIGALVCWSTTPAQAQWAVFDAAGHAQQIISTAQEIAKFVQVIQKQTDQLRSLQEQAATLHHYVDLFGNPASASPASIPALTDALAQAPKTRTTPSASSRPSPNTCKETP